MPLDGLIILENTGRPIVQSGFRSSSQAYPLLHIDCLNNALSKTSRASDVDPVLYVPAYSVEHGPSACCHMASGDLRFICPVSGDLDPLFAFAFLQTFIDILQEYFGTVNASTLKENFDVVYQLLEETLDAGGHPLTTFPNALRDIVLPPSLLTKFLSSVGGASLASGPATAGPFSSPIPWRKSGVRHTNNEIYFDVVEELKAIVNKHGTTVSSNVWGRIETNAKLSGTPDCLLSLNRPSILTDCAFHPCVRLQRWVRDKALSFVPPDGKFTLVEYRLASASEPSAQLPARDVYPLPFTVKSSISIEESTCSFQINLTSRLPSHAIENLIAEMYLGAGVVGLNCTTNRGTSGGGFSNTSGKSSGASAASSWVFDSRKSTLRWEIPLVAPSSSWSISGSFRSTPSTKPTTPRPSHAIQFRFEIPGHTYSAMKVEQLKVTQSGMGGVSDTGKGGPQKPYKGVRGRSVGDIEWRW